MSGAPSGRPRRPLQPSLRMAGRLGRLRHSSAPPYEGGISRAEPVRNASVTRSIETTSPDVRCRRAVKHRPGALPVSLLAAVALALPPFAPADGPPTPEEERAAMRLADQSLTIELVA